VRLEPSGIEVERAHAKGDMAVRGTASDLLCWLSRRGDADRLEVFGSESALSDFREQVRF
jgi:predicted lipid carrier protein YhbT